jgi:outer membrane protein
LLNFKVFWILFIFLYFFKLQINQNEKILLLSQFLSQLLLVTKQQKLKKLKLLTLILKLLMKEYTEAKDLEENIKHNLVKRKTTRADNRFKQDASNFQAQAQANGQGGRKKSGC